MNKPTLFAFGIAVFVIGGAVSLARSPQQPAQNAVHLSKALAEKFNDLSKNGNSSCSTRFQSSIVKMQSTARLKGSCCSPMSMHRYSEQVEGLKKYKAVSDQNVSEIPDDPYDIEAGLAKRLIAYYEIKLKSQEQQAYDYAMVNSNEKGPCCCRCWRWHVYGGLGKYLIRNHGFTGKQLAQLWDLSDGCGGDNEHHH
jgi:hypothetical protein